MTSLIFSPVAFLSWSATLFFIVYIIVAAPAPKKGGQDVSAFFLPYRMESIFT